MESVSILSVWHGLGGGEIRHKRGRAFWRKGDGWSVSIDTDKNVWYDFRDGVGGGVLDLIERVLRCDRRSAVEWLQNYTGVPSRQATQEERRDYSRRRARAEHEAQQLVAWRDGMLDNLRHHRVLCYRLYHECKRRIIHGDYANDEELLELLDTAEESEGKACQDDAAIDVWRQASWTDLLPLFRREGEHS
jgi:hypothetical protein